MHKMQSAKNALTREWTVCNKSKMTPIYSLRFDNGIPRVDCRGACSDAGHFRLFWKLLHVLQLCCTQHQWRSIPNTLAFDNVGLPVGKSEAKLEYKQTSPSHEARWLCFNSPSHVYHRRYRDLRQAQVPEGKRRRKAWSYQSQKTESDHQQDGLIYTTMNDACCPSILFFDSGSGEGGVTWWLLNGPPNAREKNLKYQSYRHPCPFGIRHQANNHSESAFTQKRQIRYRRTHNLFESLEFTRNTFGEHHDVCIVDWGQPRRWEVSSDRPLRTTITIGSGNTPSIKCDLHVPFLLQQSCLG